ncbi:MAG: DUF2585 family protein [Sphingomonas bacterium]|nr:DUF2585 family protein [Sphingomonas bacterium]
MSEGRASSIAGAVAAKSQLLISVIVVVAALVLLTMGRSAICPCGHVRLWWGVVQSPENSQQLFDWYSLTHLVHGLLFYAAGWMWLRRYPWQARLVVATICEAAWEIAENSPLIIDRYRAVTMAYGYSGDSVLNSVSDILCMIAGFWIARRVPGWLSIVILVSCELLALAVIRDNLTLNIVMLIHPVGAVRVWQAG